MFICDLFDIQKKIDSKIKVNNDLDDYKIRARKNLELHIKISDLANETKCYNYIKDDNFEINNSCVFEKFIKCIQQVLSIGLDNNYDCKTLEVDMDDSDYCLSDQFLNMYIDINDLIISRSEDHFNTLLEDLLSIGKKLGFNKEQILEKFKTL